MINIIALCGSLRAASINRAVLQELPAFLPPDAQIQIWPSLGNLPFYNPDWETDVPAAVTELRAAIQAADAVLIASPEYAHGITGVMKNALDCLVSSECMINKPLALFNLAARATHAQAALREVLGTMSVQLIYQACITLPLRDKALPIKQQLHTTEIAGQIRAALLALFAATRL